MKNLSDFLLKEDTVERCGIILTSGEILELENVHPSPENNFAMLNIDERPDVQATWHTHPHTSPNLSVADYLAFQEYPNLRHYVVSRSAIWCFGVRSGILQRYDDDNFTRLSEGTSS